MTFAWRKMFKKTQVRVPFAPVADVLFPRVNLADAADPVASIIEAPEFARTREFFAQDPFVARSLLPATALALLYATIRNLKPDHVVEIGTYQGGTAEVLSRALQANGQGMLHTVSPFDVERFGPVFAQWPAELRAHAMYHPVDSMGFFIWMTEQRIRPGVVFVDGNHDYEFAAFDIWSASRRMTPGGFIFIDNVAQAGPYRAATEFLAARPEWRSCGLVPGSRAPGKAFDVNRTTIPGTDFFVLQAPFSYVVGKAPESVGEIGRDDLPVSGLKIWLAAPNQIGTLNVQCFLRAFSEAKVVEIVGEGACVIDRSAESIEVRFPTPLHIEGTFDRYSVEPWLCWLGDAPLALKKPPLPF
jgi:hypothetical protein